MKTKKSQISLEYMMTLGILLLIVMVSATASINKSNDTLKIHKASIGFDNIVSSAIGVNEMAVRSYKIIGVKFAKGSKIEYIERDGEKILKLTYNFMGKDVEIDKRINFEVEIDVEDNFEEFTKLKIEKIDNGINISSVNNKVFPD